MNNEIFEKKLVFYQQEAEKALENLLPGASTRQKTVVEAMRYSLLGGGKRVRAVLLISFAEGCGLTIAQALPFAAAAEMIHAYSLIHDDLPCMDDDDMRRGKPSCHIKFGEANALLAGDALQAKAFYAMAHAADGITAENKVKAMELFANAAGENGMVGGQVIDCENDKAFLDETTLMHMYALKTGALITASCQAGCIIAGKGALCKIVQDYALGLGLAFQVVDDILDVEGDPAVLGKRTGSDKEQNKVTSVTVFGKEKAKTAADDYTDKALSALRALPFDTTFLTWYTKKLLNRLF